ncbi:hypothetical protein VP01_310g14 [Puccinia sorghi]|uniref:Uncharacterized protein n=1 Tax=Puccinia sorghi TaxID=27349 RepID=A0A0L6UZC9_9BASI|nr:hypothetical protein VP01_310g14 [Puccinia sorghi]
MDYQEGTHQKFKGNSKPTVPVAEDKEDSNLDDKAVVGTLLFNNFASTLSPIHKFAVEELYSWLARLFSREGIEEELEQTELKFQSPYNALAYMSKIWKEFLGACGHQFTARSGNVTFVMYGINPFGS